MKKPNEQSRNCRASGGKKLKKEISRLWREVAGLISRDLVPARESCVQLLGMCEDYNLCAHSEWFDAWRQCGEQVKLCLLAAERGDFSAAREKISEVNHLTRECHKFYK
ncbi:MAG: hypothetical protein HY885_14710 [Deltaproteobacteria bacterium]|nr:hypothetical protein [Deltaproteobacteria bacterium]